MAFKIRRVDYFYTMVRDEPGEAYKMLSRLAEFPVRSGAAADIPGILRGREVVVLFGLIRAEITGAAQITTDQIECIACILLNLLQV